MLLAEGRTGPGGWASDVSRGAGRLGQPQMGLNWAPEACPRSLGARLLVECGHSSCDLDTKPVKTRRGVEHPPRVMWLGVRPTPPGLPTHQPSEGSLPSPRWPWGSEGARAAPCAQCVVWARVGRRDSGAAGREESGKASWGRCCFPWALAAGLQGGGRGGGRGGREYPQRERSLAPRLVEE